jgi:hypothetical protein
MTETDFEKTMLQQISDVAWLVHQQGNRLGILNMDEQRTYTYINGKDAVEFHDETEVQHYFGNADLFNEQITSPTNVQDTYYVMGYAVDYPEPYAVENDDPDYNPNLPLFTKIQNSKVYYAAGFYCINFDKGWKYANAPKLITLEKYGYEGPFKTAVEVKHRVKTLNKQCQSQKNKS